MQSVEKELGKGMILVRELENHYRLMSGNLTYKATAEKIRQRCDYINSLDREGVKQYYKKERRKPHDDEEKDGGNIGFIELAKKTQNPLEVNLRDVEEEGGEKVFMTIAVTVNM